MNRVCGRFLLLLCCFFLFLCISGVSGDTFEELEGRGLVIRSSPPGTDVYIDGIKRGTTPLTLESLPTGSYTVRLSRDGYEERRFKVTIRELSRIEVSIDLERMTGQLHISAVQAPGSPPPERLPFEPEIFAEGEQVYGSFVSLPTGFRTITVRAFGWEEVSREVYINRDSFESLEITMVPAAYDIRNVSSGRTRFNPVNPGNLGISEINFGVSAPGEGDITIRDASGSVVFAKTLEPFTGWRQSVRWNGRTAEGNAVPDGEYLVHIDTRSIPWDDSAPLRREAELSLVIDSSIQIYPVSLSAGTPGLLFSPMPEILPAGSFQFDGTMMFGKAPLSDKAWKSLPFSGAFRFSFLELFEIGTAVNISPVFGGDAFV
ncbi:PEGA domain-containing protein, partial [Treponema sp. OttesenSCG-928-L16]|nr:PEGA domain-containing protein [Treponema sp. OttesenSCG-928-L16]MDL2229247.1 PEGA domain-containing protein [Treponema sp. OttesenSCG-928-L16]